MLGNFHEKLLRVKKFSFFLLCENIFTAYRIAGNIGGNFIWREFYLAVSRKMKHNRYWRFLIWQLQSEHDHYSQIMLHPSIKTTRAFSRNMEMYVVDSCVRGHHVSKHFWTPTIGETLVCKREPENPTDAYAVAVLANSIVVGHVPRKISAACSLFLRTRGQRN